METSVGSEDLLGKRVRNAIRGLGYTQLAVVRCESDGSTVVLRGKISSFYLKQVAQTIAAKVPGVHHVVNRLEVTEPAPSPRKESQGYCVD